MEVVHIVDVPQDPAIDQASRIVRCIRTILGQTYLDQPIDENVAVKHLLVDTDAPSAMGVMGIAFLTFSLFKFM